MAARRRMGVAMTIGYGRLLGSVLTVLLVGGCAAQRMSADAPGGAGEPNPSVGDEWRTEGCRTTRTPEVVETAGARMPLIPADLEAVMSRIGQEGPARFAESYAGLEVVYEPVHTIVYRVPSAGFDAFVREIAGDACVVVRDAAHSAVELTALAERIGVDLDYWRGRGVRVNSVGPLHDGSGVRVGTQDVALAEVELPKRYGVDPPVMVVEEGPAVPLAGRRITPA